MYPQRLIADQHALAIDFRRDTLARKYLQVGSKRWCDLLRTHIFHDCFGEWMTGKLFYPCGKQISVAGSSLSTSTTPVTTGCPVVIVPVLSSTATLILACELQRMREFLIRIPCWFSATATDHHRGWCCQAQGTRASDDQYRHRTANRGPNVAGKQRPDHQRGERHRQHDWHEPGHHNIRQTLNFRFGLLGFFDQANHLRQCCIAGGASHTSGERLAIDARHKQCHRFAYRPEAPRQ